MPPKWVILSKVKNVVLDADALTCFKKKPKELYALLDKNKIITPHIAEFHKIFPKIKKNITNIEKIKEARKLIKSNIILKGPNTIILSHNKKIVLSICGEHNQIKKFLFFGINSCAEDSFHICGKLIAKFFTHSEYDSLCSVFITPSISNCNSLDSEF